MKGSTMAFNYIQEGDVLTLTPAADVPAGFGYLFGVSLFGIAINDVSNGKPGAFATEGVWEIPKTSALAIAVGDRVFWDPTNKVVNKTAAGQQCIGIAVTAAANPSATVQVLLEPPPPSGS
jgi:predicted RecA/RadA family phage recombinase